MSAAKLQSVRIKTRYYLCQDGRLAFRIPNALYRNLIRGKVLLSQFANTRQLLLEAIITATPDGQWKASANGIIYRFDAYGRLDLAPFAEFAARNVETKSVRRTGTVLDIAPVLNGRRARSENTWKPERALVHAAELDADAASAKKAHRIPILKVD